METKHKAYKVGGLRDGATLITYVDHGNYNTRKTAENIVDFLIREFPARTVNEVRDIFKTIWSE